MAEQTIRNRSQLRRLMAHRTVVALLIVHDARYRLRLNWANADSLFAQAEDNGHCLKADPDSEDPYLWLRITASQDL